jgi:hypothetical protein
MVMTKIIMEIAMFRIIVASAINGGNGMINNKMMTKAITTMELSVIVLVHLIMFELISYLSSKTAFF